MNEPTPDRIAEEFGIPTAIDSDDINWPAFQEKLAAAIRAAEERGEQRAAAKLNDIDNDEVTVAQMRAAYAEDRLDAARLVGWEEAREACRARLQIMLDQLTPPYTDEAAHANNWICKALDAIAAMTPPAKGANQ